MEVLYFSAFRSYGKFSIRPFPFFAKSFLIHHQNRLPCNLHQIPCWSIIRVSVKEFLQLSCIRDLTLFLDQHLRLLRRLLRLLASPLFSVIQDMFTVSY